MNAFWFHYNKPASQRAGKPQLTIHWKGQCLIVDALVCNRPVHSRIRSTQPRLVISGRCNDITIQDNIATIN